MSLLIIPDYAARQAKERYTVRRKVAVIIILLILGSSTACSSNTGRLPGPRATEDSIKFKEEYEGLNSVLNDDGTSKYPAVSIDRANNIDRLTYDELEDFLENKTGLLYFGRPGCSWCRRLVPVMLEYAKEDNVIIYYYDIEKDRDENNAQYKKILSILGEYLPTDTVIQNEEDPEFDPELKRVVLPQLFFIKDGEVKSGLMLYQHEYLRDGNSEKVKLLLRYSYDSIASYSGKTDGEDCEC